VANNITFIIQLKDQFAATARQVNRQFDQMKMKADSVGASIAQMAKRTKDSFVGMRNTFAIGGAALTASVTVPATLAARSMINAASDAEETANKFNEVFKGIGAQSAATVQQLTGGYNLATSSAQELLSNTGDLLVGLGMTREESLALSADVVKLSADVASFKNVEGGTARAADSLTKALLGERDSLKETFKTAVMEEDVKKRAAIMRMKDRALTDKQARALATLAIVTERNKDAIGDLARTADSYANVSRANEEATKALSESFGRLLLPLATELLKVGIKVTNWLNNLSPGMKKFVLILGGLAAIAGPILLLLAGVATAFTVITLPVMAVSAAVLALIAIGTLLIAKWDDITASLSGAWEGLKMMATDAAAWIGEKFGSAWDFIKAGALGMADFVISAINSLIAPLSMVSEAMGLGSLQIPSVATPTSPVSAATGTIQGQIVVSAAPGASVVSTKSKTAGSGLNMGVNMAMAR